MIKSLVKLGSIVFLVLGLIKMLTGDPSGAVMIAVGAIMDLQAAAMDMNDRVTALEKKENKDATESSQGS